ncbi:MAG TPA: shikimate kinase, partial [Gemmatimonadales bacterium]|nr:shikimate kinase [Gemmatimonadales bacterium]
VKAAQAGSPGVIVPGGGWAAQPGQLAAVISSGLVVYLRCLPATAAKRTRQGEARPLLAGVDPAQQMRVLFEEREPFYLLAPHEVDAEYPAAEAVASQVLALARQHGGW